MIYQKPISYLITKGDLTPNNYEQEFENRLAVLAAAVESKISFIQIREKFLPAKLVSDFVSRVVALALGSSTKILVNDRVDIAIAEAADGVHLTSTSIPTNYVRKLVSRDFIVGVSTHSKELTLKAQTDGASFVTFGPIFETPSKVRYGPPQGLEKLRDVCRSVGEYPVIAIGGIDETNVEKVLETGAAGFAAIRFMNKAENFQLLQKRENDCEQE